jgi:hypothetical protein
MAPPPGAFAQTVCYKTLKTVNLQAGMGEYGCGACTAEEIGRWCRYNRSGAQELVANQTCAPDACLRAA